MYTHTSSESHDGYPEADRDHSRLPRAFTNPLNIDTLHVHHPTKPSSSRLSTTSRQHFFLADDSDSDQSPARHSFRRREIILALPVTNTPRLVRNRAKLPWTSLVEKISRYQDPLMKHKLTDFDPDIEIADWNDICTKLETMRAMCKASHSDANLTYDGETEIARTPRHVTNNIHNDRMEASTTSMQPLVNFASAEALGALSGTNTSFAGETPSLPLALTFPQSVLSETFGGFKMRNLKCIPLIQEDLKTQQCSFGRSNSQIHTLHHWLVAHLFRPQKDGRIDLSLGQLGHMYDSLLRCPEKHCHQHGGFFWKENFQDHMRKHRDGLSPGRLLVDIEKREADVLHLDTKYRSNGDHHLLTWQTSPSENQNPVLAAKKFDLTSFPSVEPTIIRTNI
ncbi:hypothetical protein BU17DRAFT_70337 [Hysterangium stoloniferum]|nr:hypothetical protein BU17DRAFT_70337 [Hysterangium stoloniferum]